MLKNFTPLDGDMDYSVEERKFFGRMTKKRYKSILKYVRDFNYEASAPYGRSPNGYAYRCGCEHDCCGHLVREGIDVDIKRILNTPIFLITLTHSQSFNY